ncbi:MAG: hypothetical protein MZV63_72230 [Marinilabiliales bacterium]|nr:hypothetical protein [Marinilabiliales bacterium]
MAMTFKSALSKAVETRWSSIKKLCSNRLRLTVFLHSCHPGGCQQLHKSSDPGQLNGLLTDNTTEAHAGSTWKTASGKRDPTTGRNDLHPFLLKPARIYRLKSKYQDQSILKDLQVFIQGIGVALL